MLGWIKKLPFGIKLMLIIGKVAILFLLAINLNPTLETLLHDLIGWY